MVSVCFRVVVFGFGLTLQKGIELHVGGALVGRLCVPPRAKVLEKGADHLKRVAATERTSMVNKVPAAMRSSLVILVLIDLGLIWVRH